MPSAGEIYAQMADAIEGDIGTLARLAVDPDCRLDLLKHRLTPAASRAAAHLQAALDALRTIAARLD